jgi:hypothetical protein
MCSLTLISSESLGTAKKAKRVIMQREEHSVLASEIEQMGSEFRNCLDNHMVFVIDIGGIIAFL